MTNKYFEYIKVSVIICLVAFLFSCNDEDKPYSNDNKVIEKQEVINDAEMLKKFLQKAEDYYIKNGGTQANDYKKQTLGKSCEVNLKSPSSQSIKRGAFYKELKKSILLMGILTKQEETSSYVIGTASAFSISKDGICVTNYHVFKSFDPAKPKEYETVFVMDVKGNVYPVIEVLAASKHDDLAVFRIDCKGKEMLPLALGNDSPVGEEINLISHPDRRFYSYSQGHINRTYLKPGTSKIRQCISAEFAKGSSGAPIMDNYGNVVGVVAGTQNIYYDQRGKGYQMTIREIIPVSKLKALFE